MTVTHTVTSANILPFVHFTLSPPPFVPMGTFFYLLLQIPEGEKSLVMVLNEDSEGSDQTLFCPGAWQEMKAFAVK